MAAAPEDVLFVLYHSAVKPVQERLRNHFQKYTVIVQEIKYDDIKKGMTVVYLKSTGVRVCHSVVGETRGGFLVQGVNNDVEDAELVTEDNFIGVIVEAYASADTAFRAETAQRLASKGKIHTGNRT